MINDLNKLHYLLEIVEGNYESGNQQLITDYQIIANKMNFQLSILKIISITKFYYSEVQEKLANKII